MANENKEVDFESAEETQQQEMEAMGLDDMSSNWIPHVKVGEDIILEIKKVFKDKNIDAKDKDGRAFKTNLTGVNWKPVIETFDGKTYSCTAWEEWKKIRTIIKEKMEDKTLFDETKKEFIKPLKIKIGHPVDGFKDKKSKENYTVEEVA